MPVPMPTPGVAPRTLPLPVYDVLRRHRYELALLATVAIWGVNVPVLKLALREIAPAHANAFRFTLGALALGTVGWLERRRRGITLGDAVRGRLGTLALLGLFGYFAYQEAFIYGVAHTSAASAALLTATSPLWTAVLGHATGVDRLRRTALPGMALALLGACVVALGKKGSGLDTVAGNMTMVGSAALWAAFTVRQTRLAGVVPPATGAFVSLLVALVGLYVLALVTPATGTLATLSPAALGALVYSGVLSVGVTFAVWNAAVAHVGPTTTASFGYLTPLFAATAALVLLGEPITAWHLVGGLLLIGGLVWMRRARPAAAPAAQAGQVALRPDAVGTDAP